MVYSLYPAAYKRSGGTRAAAAYQTRLLFSDMEPAQRKLYNRTRDYYRGMLIGMIEQGGMNDTRMKESWRGCCV